MRPFTLSGAAERVTLDADGLPVRDEKFEENRRAAAVAFFEAASDSDLPDDLDMYARDAADFRDISARIPGLIVTSAGGMCPFQAYGTLHGLDLYFRYRSGYATLSVGGDVTWEPCYNAGLPYGHPLDGYLDRTQFANLLVLLTARLERAKFRYYFSGRHVDVERAEDNELRFTVSDKFEQYVGWGTSPEDAFEQATTFTLSEWMLEKGWSEAAQRTSHRLRTLHPTPLNEDTRIFPAPEPVFTATGVAEAEAWYEATRSDAR